MPIELPHRGTLRASGTCWRTKSRVSSAAWAREMVERADGVEQPAAGVHLAHDLVHGGQRLGRGGDHQIGTFRHHVELVVGHQGGDLDDAVAPGVEPRHLQI